MTTAAIRAAQARARMDAIVLDNPRAQHAHQVFDYMVAHGEQTRGDRRCVLLTGPSQSGKSTILKPYAARENTAERLKQHQVPVLFVDLKPTITTKGLAQAILGALERHGFTTGPLNGSETVLLLRADRLLAAARVKLLIIDEFHHIQNIQHSKTAWLVGEMIKLLLIEGRCPVVLSGIETAKTPLLQNRQLSQRAEPTIELHRLSADSYEDRKLFVHFMKRFVAEAEVASGVRDITAQLTSATAACLHEASQGVLGAACNLIKAAVVGAIVQGREALTPSDLIDAADRYVVALGLHQRNPFRDGYQRELARSA